MVDRQKLDGLLEQKAALEARAPDSPEFSRRLRELRHWQSQRLAASYADLRVEPRYAAALEFFLGDLYGPEDFTQRDADLKRALTHFKRALPAGLLQMLGEAIELQVLSLELDREMVMRLDARAVSRSSYAAAYRSAGRSEDRRRQIDLIIRIGEDLARVVDQRWVGLALRAAHYPAHAAGFGVLQRFLERGFRAFRRLGDARYLLGVIRERETRLMEALLLGDGTSIPKATGEPAVNA